AGSALMSISIRACAPLEKPSSSTACAPRPAPSFSAPFHTTRSVSLRTPISASMPPGTSAPTAARPPTPNPPRRPIRCIGRPRGHGACLALELALSEPYGSADFHPARDGRSNPAAGQGGVHDRLGRRRPGRAGGVRRRGAVVPLRDRGVL